MAHVTRDYWTAAALTAAAAAAAGGQLICRRDGRTVCAHVVVVVVVVVVEKTISPSLIARVGWGRGRHHAAAIDFLNDIRLLNLLAGAASWWRCWYLSRLWSLPKIVAHGTGVLMIVCAISARSSHQWLRHRPPVRVISWTSMYCTYEVAAWS